MKFAQKKERFFIDKMGGYNAIVEQKIKRKECSG